MKKRRFVLFLSAFVLSCGNPHLSQQLDMAEAVMIEHPDSALAIIKTIDTLSLKTRSMAARYALLHTMALDKNFIDTTDMSVIRPALEYYSRHGSPSEKMKAFFYRGVISANQGEDNEAMRYYLLALEDSAKVADNHFKELVTSAMSDIFSRNYNPEQELIYTQDALKYARLAGHSEGIWSITGHLASSYANCKRWEESRRTYIDYFAMPVYDTSSMVRRSLFYAKDLLRFPEMDPAKSVEIVEEMSRRYPESMTVEGYCVYAYAQQLLGNSEVAEDIFRQLETLIKQQEKVKVWRYRVSRAQGHYKQALEDLEASVMFQDSVVFSSMCQSLLKTQRDYSVAEATALKKENQLNIQRIVFLVLTFILLLVCVVFLFLSRRNALRSRIDELASLHQEAQQMLSLQYLRTSDITAQLEEKDQALLQLRAQFAVLYKAQYKTLNDLCAAYLSPVKKERKDILYDEAMRQLDVIINDGEAHTKFMSIVNGSLDNIIDKLRLDLPGHKEQDFQFLMYIIVGFDATTISNLTGYTVGTVYTKKARLKGEISNLNSQYRDFYLDYLE